MRPNASGGKRRGKDLEPGELEDGEIGSPVRGDGAPCLPAPSSPLSPLSLLPPSPPRSPPLARSPVTHLAFPPPSPHLPLPTPPSQPGPTASLLASSHARRGAASASAAPSIPPPFSTYLPLGRPARLIRRRTLCCTQAGRRRALAAATRSGVRTAGPACMAACAAGLPIRPCARSAASPTSPTVRATRPPCLPVSLCPLTRALLCRPWHEPPDAWPRGGHAARARQTGRAMGRPSQRGHARQQPCRRPARHPARAEPLL